MHQRVKYFREKDEFFFVVKKILINFVLSIWTALRCIVPCWVYMCRGFGGENGGRENVVRMLKGIDLIY